MFHSIAFEFKKYFQPRGFLIAWFGFVLISCLIYLFRYDQIGVDGWTPYDMRAMRDPAAIYNYLTNLVGSYFLYPVIYYSSLSHKHDINLNVWPILYTQPQNKRTFLLSRLFALCLVSCAFAVALLIGTAIAYSVSGVRPVISIWEQIWAFLAPFTFGLIPNIFIYCTLFFSLSYLSKPSNRIAYVAVFILIAEEFIDAISKKVLFDFTLGGHQTVEIQTKFWMNHEFSHRLINLDWALFQNRMLGLSIACLFLTLAIWRFKFSARLTSPKLKLPKSAETHPIALHRPPSLSQNFGGLDRVKTILHIVRFGSGEKPSWLINTVVFLITFAMLSFALNRGLHDASEISTSSEIIKTFSDKIFPFFYLWLLLYVLNIAWSDREVRINQIKASLPIHNVDYLFAQYLQILKMAFFLVSFASLICVAKHGIQSNFDIDWSQFLVRFYAIKLPELFVNGVTYLFLASVSKTRVQATAILVSYVFVSSVLSKFINYSLLNLFTLPELSYSDLTGYDGSLSNVLWHLLWWGGWASIVAMMTIKLWHRAEFASGKEFWRRLLTPNSRPMKWSLCLTSICIVTSGSLILTVDFFLQPYQTTTEITHTQVSYERKYAFLKSLAQPSVSSVKLNIDLVPETKNITIKGRYTLINKSTQAISEVYLSRYLFDQLTIDYATNLELNSRQYDEKHRVMHWSLTKALQPDETFEIEFNLKSNTRWLGGIHTQTMIGHFNTFIDNYIMPTLGFNWDNMLSDDELRAKYGLTKNDFYGSKTDALARQGSTYSGKPEEIFFEATVSTAKDQIAIMPGRLIDQYIKNERAFFTYKTFKPISNFYSLQSGHFQVKRDEVNGMPIEIYFHPKHGRNAQRFLECMRASINYYSDNFSPYPLDFLRIVEFTSDEVYAQGFPGTIPFSEYFGFHHDLEKSKVDYPCLVTAHEVAHQWWAHQLIPAKAEGSNVLDETLSEYSSMRVYQNLQGQSKIDVITKYNQKTYFSERRNDIKGEKALNEMHGQSYLRYYKGAIVFEHLNHELGSDRINIALRNLLKTYNRKSPPYAISDDLVNEILKVTPADKKELVLDLLTRVVEYEFDVVSHSNNWTSKSKNNYLVSIKLTGKKNVSDQDGEVNVEPYNGKLMVRLYFGKNDFRDIDVEFKNGQGSLNSNLYSEPKKIEVDPRQWFIIRNRNSDGVKLAPATFAQQNEK